MASAPGRLTGRPLASQAVSRHSLIPRTLTRGIWRSRALRATPDLPLFSLRACAAGPALRRGEVRRSPFETTDLASVEVVFRAPHGPPGDRACTPTSLKEGHSARKRRGCPWGPLRRRGRPRGGPARTTTFPRPQNHPCFGGSTMLQPARRAHVVGNCRPVRPTRLQRRRSPRRGQNLVSCR